MVTHKRLQNYNRYYCKACMTGCFGCRWHRYQQSKDDTHPKDFVFLALSIGAFLFVTFWFYFWLIAENSKDTVNWFFYGKMHSWFDWHYLFICMSSLAFTYVVLLMLLALLHLAHGQELYMHWVHKVLIILTVTMCVASCILIEDFWSEGYQLFVLSLQETGPFLQMGAVAIMTFLTWFIAENWFHLYKVGTRIFWLGIYIAVMIALYTIPALYTSPCILDFNLPARPTMFAHRGFSAIAPENTMEAFKRAAEFDNVIGLETDVSISWDGFPFLMHDDKLLRTTNVKQVFPDKADNYAWQFNLTELKMLDAGSWFLEHDPHRTVSSLTTEEKTLYRNLTIPTFEEYLLLAKEKDLYVIFDLKFKAEGPGSDHPYASSFVQRIEEIINDTGIDHEKVLWILEDRDTAYNFTKVAAHSPSLSYLKENGITWTNSRYDKLTWKTLREFQENNITSVIWIVDSSWLYSLLWCAGLNHITGNNPAHLAKSLAPAWYMSSSLYLTAWVLTDVLSFIIVVAIFAIQKIRKSGKEFHPESVSLQAARTRINHMRQNRNMKEKLLRTAEGIHESDPGILGTHMMQSPVQEVYDISGGIGNHMRGESMGEISVSSSGGYPASEGGFSIGQSGSQSNDIRLKEVHVEYT